MAKWMINGYEVGGTVNSATAISCLDKDGNLSNVQDELDKLYNKHLFVTELPKNPDEDTYYYLPEE